MIIADQDVPVSAEMLWSGVAFLPVSAQYRVLGVGEAVLQDWTAISGPFVSGSLEFTVPSVLNTMAVGALKEPRLVEMQVTSAAFAGAQTFTADYVIGLDAPQLTLMVNSFQTYADALVVGDDLSVELLNWADATKSARVSAMMSAFRALSRMNYEISNVDDPSFRDRAGYGLNTGGAIGQLYAYSEMDFLALDSDFIACIRRAQVAEADALLTSGADSHAAMRESGIMMNSVGDASIMFRAGKGVESSINRKSLNHMKNYLSSRIRMTRV